MSIDEIRERVITLLEEICEVDSEKILVEYQTYGDAEIDSVYFYEIIGVLEAELGTKVSDKMLKEVHKRVKSSFSEFCNLWLEMQGGD